MKHQDHENRTFLDAPATHVLALWAATDPEFGAPRKDALISKVKIAKAAHVRDEPVLLRVARATGHRAQFLRYLAEIEWRFALTLETSGETLRGAAWDYLPLPFRNLGQNDSALTPTRVEERFDVLGYGDWEVEWEKDMLTALGWFDPFTPVNWRVVSHTGHKKSGKYRIPRFVLDLIVEMANQPRGAQKRAYEKRKDCEALCPFPKPGIRSKKPKPMRFPSLLPDYLKPQASPYGEFLPPPLDPLGFGMEIPALDKPAKPAGKKKKR